MYTWKVFFITGLIILPNTTVGSKKTISPGAALALLAEGNIEILKKYFENNKIVPPIDNTDLQIEAKKYGYPDLVTWLIEKDEERKDREFRIPYAIRTLDEAQLKKFIILQKIDLQHKDDKGNTFLHRAAKKGMTSFCFWLIKMGLSIHTQNHGGNRPIELNKKKTEAIERLFVENETYKIPEKNQISVVRDMAARLDQDPKNDLFDLFNFYGYRLAYFTIHLAYFTIHNKKLPISDFFATKDPHELLYRFKLALILGSTKLLRDLFEYLKYHESTCIILASELYLALNKENKKNYMFPFDFDLNPHFHPGKNTLEDIGERFKLPAPKNIFWLFAYFANILVNNQPEITDRLIQWIRHQPQTTFFPELANYLKDTEQGYPTKQRIRHRLKQIFITEKFATGSKKNLCDLKIICKK